MSEHGFSPLKPQLWQGKYKRIPGQTTVFHVRLRNGRWWPWVDWETGSCVAHCAMVDSVAARQLASAVNAGKGYLMGSAGGAFLVNEYGQVLVPAKSGTGNVALVGDWAGGMLFHDPLQRERTFDLTEEGPVQKGDTWDLPRVGIPYNLSRRNQIYFWEEKRSGGRKIVPEEQDSFLISALRSVRPFGPVRFLVTAGGLVLTKVPVRGWSEGEIEARFVGKINYNRWFPKEK